MIKGSRGDLTFEVQEGGPGEWQLVFDSGLINPEISQSRPLERPSDPCPTLFIHVPSPD